MARKETIVTFHDPKIVSCPPDPDKPPITGQLEEGEEPPEAAPQSENESNVSQSDRAGKV